MLFPASTISQIKKLSNDSLGHSCTITAGGETVYTGSAHVFDDMVKIKREIGGDAAFDADALIRLPHQSDESWTTPTFDPQSATLQATYEGVTRKGNVAKVMRRQAMCFVGAKWIDKSESTTLGTITNLTVMAGENSGEALLLFTAPAGHTSLQAQVDGSNSGDAVSDTDAILLTGLTPGTYDFTVNATDGTTTTTSNSVSFEVV